MNANKSASNNYNNNGWILCPSKSFPGKFYYFNVLTGEAVWGISDDEKTTINKKGNQLNIQKLNNRFHGFMEPSSPPKESPEDPSTQQIIGTEPNTSNNCQDQSSFQSGIFTQQSPMFGQQAVFPTTAMFGQQGVFPTTPMFGQQAVFPTIPLFGQQAVFPTSPILGQQAMFPTQIEHWPMANPYWMPIQYPSWPYSQSKKSTIDRVTQTAQLEWEVPVEASERPLCQRFGNFNEEEYKTLNKPKQFASSTPIKNSNTRTELSGNKMTSTNNEETGAIKLKTLKGSDLRLLLLAKRKKSHEDSIDSLRKKKIQTLDTSTPKKKVTFDLNTLYSDSDNGSNDGDQFIIQNPTLKRNSGTYTPLSPILNCTTIQNTTFSNMPTEMTNTKNRSTNFEMPDNFTNGLTNNGVNTKFKIDYSGINGTTKFKIDNFANINMTKEGSNKNGVSRNVTENSIDIEAKETESNTILKRDMLYLMVDMDVLLDENNLVNELLQSDKKNRLLIPHALRAEIEALCIGDCRGQQRVLVARHLSRRMAMSHQQYIVIPQGEDKAESTTDSILKCCLKVVNEKYHLILITKDPYLITRANELKIKCYTPQQIKNGANINPKLLTDMNKIKITIDNVANHETNFPHNQFTSKEGDCPVNAYKKQLFASDEQTKNCDILINITKPKSKINDNIGIFNYITKNTISNSNSLFFSQNDSQNHFNFANQSQNIDISNQITQNESNLNGIFMKDNQNTSDLNSTENIKKILRSTASVNRQSSFNKSDSNDNTNQTAAKQRIEKVKNLLSPKNQKLEDLLPIPALLPLKKGTKNTSTPKQGSIETDKIRSNFKNSDTSLEDALKEYCVKSKMVHDKIKTRMEEWICTYTQIMEELLNNILENNPEQTNKIDTSDTNLHELLTCVKMMYNNTKLKHTIETLGEFLKKCTCWKGKFKLNTTPNDFMKIIGCGILLVQNLKNILPTTDWVIECESRLLSLLNNIEHENNDLDPDLVKPTTVCRSEIDDDCNFMRRNYIKDPSYIISYLKKHFTEWSTYDNIESNKKLQNIKESKVVRMFGIHLNNLKIDNNKSLSYIETDVNTGNNETRLMKLLHNDRPNINIRNENISINQNINIDASIVNQENDINTRSKMMGIPENTNQAAGLKVIRNIHEHEKKINKEPLELYEIDYLDADNLENDINTRSKMMINFENTNETAGLKVIRNIQMIDEYEKKINKKPLDLDALDYSDVDNYSEKSMEISEIANDRSYLHNKYTPTNIFNDSDQNNASRKNEQNTFQSRKNDQNLIHENSVNKSEKYNNCNTKSSNVGGLNNNYGSEGHYSDENYVNDNNNYAVNNNYGKHNDNYANQITQRDDSNDSGFENDSTQAHTFVKTFLYELSATFKVIYKFIVSFIEEFRGKAMSQERKNILHVKASKCLQNIIAIIHQLKSIINRECHEITILKSLLLRAGVEATSDKRITRYRHVVLKCLEQAQILENALKIIACITIEDLDAISNNADSISSSIRYLNIFE